MSITAARCESVINWVSRHSRQIPALQLTTERTTLTKKTMFKSIHDKLLGEQRRIKASFRQRGSAFAMFLWAMFVGFMAVMIFFRGGDDLHLSAHPEVKGGGGLESFVMANCDKETQEIWEQVAWYAEYQKIDPAVPFAIAFADSSCGKNLTTANNIGNVFNDDSGNRVAFKDMFTGWRLLIDTLNNRHLNQNYMIGHLSEGGRRKLNSYHRCHTAPAGWKCYASSQQNWSVNTVNALKNIYQDNSLDDGFEFRLK